MASQATRWQGEGLPQGVAGARAQVLVAVAARHPLAPLWLRERLLAADADLVRQLLSPRFQQAVLLATCNRVEVYTVASDPPAAARALQDVFLERAESDRPDLRSALDVYIGDEVPAHLFRVAAGLDSQVLGEAEILGQVGAALRSSAGGGLAGHHLIRLFHHAIRAGRRARAETAIGREAGSVSSAAVKLATRALGGLAGRTALIVGAGEAATLSARALLRSGLDDVWVANRTRERAEALARELRGKTVAWDRVRDAIAQVDVVVTATGAPEHVILAGDIREAMRGRPERPLLVLDIAVPRDVDPAAKEVPGVHLFNVDDLNATLDAGIQRRRAEVGRVEAVVEEELERFQAWWRTVAVTPAIRDLHQQAEHLRKRELDKALRRLPRLTGSERAVLEGLTRSIAQKLIHDPIVSLKERAKGGRPDGDALMGWWAPVFDDEDRDGLLS